MFSESLNKDIYDMASATNKTNGLPTYRRETKDDASKWARKAAFIISPQDLDEKTARRALGIALKGKAFDWFMDTVQRNPDMTVEHLFKSHESRFLSGIKENEIAQRFLTEEIPKTAENFFDLLKDGRCLVDLGYVSARTVADQVKSGLRYGKQNPG